MRAILALSLVLIFSAFVMADECVKYYAVQLNKINAKDAEKEAISQYCSGNHHFIELVGTENLLLGISPTSKWRNLPIRRDTIFYDDTIKCKEQSDFLSSQDNYVRQFNKKMANCLQDGTTCCSNAATMDSCVEVVAKVNEKTDKINEYNIQEFLDTFIDPRCTGVEYAEGANETVFNLMGNTPGKFFRVYKKADTKIHDAINNDVLNQPIHDLINYPKIMKSIETSITDVELKEYAIKLFSPYYERHIREKTEWEQNNKMKWEYQE